MKSVILPRHIEAAKFQNMIGYLPGEMRGTNNRKRRDDLTDQFELEPKGKIKKMSKGMKQKL